MRTLLFPVLLVALLASVGCNRGQPDQPGSAEAGSGNYARLGPIGLSVESVRHGKVRIRGMMGQDGESKEDIFTIKTRFKLFDTAVPVKQPAIQRDGGLISIGESKLKLYDAQGRQAKPVVAGGFDGVRARRSDTAVLTADHSETTDLLTFESISGATGDLTLEVPANYQVMQSDGNFLQPKEPGTFKIRIPQAMWNAPPPTTDAGPGHWATVGPVGVSVESAKLGKVKVRTFQGTGDSAEDVLALAVRVKLADTAALVKKPPFIPSGIGASFSGAAVTLRSARSGETYKAVTASGLHEFIGRQSKDIELSAKQPELTDLLTFEARAAEVDELILTLWPKWQERKPDGTWADTAAEGDFRFRIPKSLWAK